MVSIGGTNATFHCEGNGTEVDWTVNGFHPHHNSNQHRRISVVTLLTPSSGTVQSNLTLPATSENNGITVQCGIRSSPISPLVLSNSFTLTVLPGEF